MSSRTEAQGHTFQSTIHSPAWMDLVYRSRGRSLVSRKGLQTLNWDLLSMAVSQVEPTLKPYDSYLPPLYSHRVQDAPLNNLDEVHKWMQLYRLEATDDMECGNLEFLCTLNTPSPERMRYLLDLCKDKRTAHLRRTLLETQDLLRIPLFFWEGASHQMDRGGWWVRALSQELTSKCGMCKRIWPAHQLAKDGCTECTASTLQRQASPKKKKGAKTKLQQTLGLVMRSALPEEIEKICQHNLNTILLYSDIVPHSTLFGRHDAGNGYIGGRRPHQWGHSSPHTSVVHIPRTRPPSHRRQPR